MKKTKKITRKIKSLGIIVRTNSNIHISDQNKKRVFNEDKLNYILKSLKSLVITINLFNKKYPNFKINLTLIDQSNSETVNQKFKDLQDLELQALISKKWVTILKLNDSRLLDAKTDFKISNNLTSEFLVIDNFYENPDEVRDFALSCDFSPHPQYHKGQRTEQKFIPEGIKERFETLLHSQITSWEDQGANGVFQYCTAEDQLVYHVDSQSYAAVVYLTKDAPPSCGTTFFKSRRTGLRNAPTQKDCESFRI